MTKMNKRKKDGKHTTVTFKTGEDGEIFHSPVLENVLRVVSRCCHTISPPIPALPIGLKIH